MCLKSIWKCCSDKLISKCENWAVRWHQVPQKMVSVALYERWLSSHFAGSCKWAVVGNCLPCHQDYITQFKDILQFHSGFVVISVKLWSLLLVFKLCMWRGEKCCLHSSRFWYFFLNSCTFSSWSSSHCLLSLYWLSASWSLIGFFNYS